MKISEIMQSSPEAIISKIGKGPYLYYDENGDIIIDCSLERILSFYVKDGIVLDDIDICAYGFKKDESDALQYIAADDLKKRFEEMESNDSYEYIEAVDNNGVILQVPSYCGFDELVYFFEDGETDMIVNCKPIESAIKEELQRRLEKSNMVRK